MSSRASSQKMIVSSVQKMPAMATLTGRDCTVPWTNPSAHTTMPTRAIMNASGESLTVAAPITEMMPRAKPKLARNGADAVSSACSTLTACSCMGASYRRTMTVAALPSAGGDQSSDEPQVARLAQLAADPPRAPRDDAAARAARPLQGVRVRRAVVVHAAALDDDRLLARVQRAAARHGRPARLPAVRADGPR